tara:strand:+ start:104 stop:256 length:153 start_codon:yes stop_codon:yes gene_type:complete
MIKYLLELLDHAEGETENIKIAQGKYKIPETFKEGFKQLKNEYRWLKQSK